MKKNFKPKIKKISYLALAQFCFPDLILPSALRWLPSPLKCIL